jgi:hypothetical protein
MHTEKQIRRAIREELRSALVRYTTKKLNEAPDEKPETEKTGAEEADDATRAQIVKGLKFIWPEEDFSKAVPSSKAKLDALKSALSDILRTSAEGNITALAKKVDSATDSMVGKD